MNRLSGLLVVGLLAACKGNINNNELPLPLTARVSIDAHSFQANNTSDQPSISADGRYVVFRSIATNLIPADPEGKADVFLKDTSVGSVERLSVVDGNKSTGGNGDSSEPFISADGSTVAFSSLATNLDSGVIGDNALSDIFLTGPGKGKMLQISIPTGQPTNGASTHPTISSDGLIVAFQSDARNLNAAPPDTNLVTDIYIYDVAGAKVLRVSLGTGGAEPTAACINPMISGDSRWVVFQTLSTNFGVADANGVADIVRVNLGTGAVEYVSVRTDGTTTGNGGSFDPAISYDGRFVVFSSDASNLVAADANAARDVFIRDMTLGVTTRVSQNTTGGDPDGASNRPTVSADGRFVAFDSAASNLIGLDTNAFNDVFIADVITNQIQRGTVRTFGGEAAGTAVVLVAGRISEDGRFITMVSTSPNLVDNDTNTAPDVFLRGPLK